jgi:hypothetical protein
MQKPLILAVILAAVLNVAASARPPVNLTIHADHPGPPAGPTLCAKAAPGFTGPLTAPRQSRAGHAAQAAFFDLAAAPQPCGPGQTTTLEMTPPNAR